MSWRTNWRDRQALAKPRLATPIKPGPETFPDPCLKMLDMLVDRAQRGEITGIAVAFVSKDGPSNVYAAQPDAGHLLWASINDLQNMFAQQRLKGATVS